MLCNTIMAFLCGGYQSCHPEAGFFPLWRWPEGKQPLLRFDKLIFTTYDGNNCFILLRATLGKAA
jgi:hypothetical protein